MNRIPFGRAGVSPPLGGGMRGVRLRTLVVIRWAAVIGQLVTLLTVHYGLGMELPIALALAVVAVSALLNLLVTVRWPLGLQLRDHEAALYLAYDTLQLAALLLLAGGLKNPFALLFLAPVTVSATILSRTSTICLCALVVVCASGLALWSHPLPWPDQFEPPSIYVLGHWLAIIISSGFLASYAGSVAAEARRMSDALAASQMALAREQRMSALGGLAAAVAHELGSPLNTITVVAKEMARDLPPGSAMEEDVTLLVGQADRCRDILAQLSQRSDPDDAAFHNMPLSALVEMIATPHRREGVAVVFTTEIADGVTEPLLARVPEIGHGLGNLIQNAVQFARRRVEVTTLVGEATVAVVVADDGPGYPPALFGRLGEPYVSGRAGEAGHMGLGLFIAQTLLARTGASVTFRNRESGGAEVAVRWRRESLEAALGSRDVFRDQG